MQSARRSALTLHNSLISFNSLTGSLNGTLLRVKLRRAGRREPRIAYKVACEQKIVNIYPAHAQDSIFVTGFTMFPFVDFRMRYVLAWEPKALKRSGILG